MRAVVLQSEGGPDVLQVQDVEIPQPGEGETRVALAYASLNHLDIWIRKGMPSVPKPRIMGADGAGLVDAEGTGTQPPGGRVLIDPSITCGRCRFCERGDTVLCSSFQVLGEHTDGTHAEFVVVPTENLHPVPEHLSQVEAAALPLVYATAWRMLVTRAGVSEGERVLVWGASSGVGSAAVQLASAMGAEVTATTRNSAKLDTLRGLGAHHVVDSSTTDVVERVREQWGKDGVDVVFDHLGEVAWKPSLALLGRGGRFVTCGATTGANPPAALTRIFWKQLSVLGSTMASKSDFAAMLAFVTEHQLHPLVDRVFPLEQVQEAHAYLEAAHQVGKVMLELPPPTR